MTNNVSRMMRIVTTANRCSRHKLLLKSSSLSSSLSSTSSLSIGRRTFCGNRNGPIAITLPIDSGRSTDNNNSNTSYNSSNNNNNNNKSMRLYSSTTYQCESEDTKKQDELSEEDIAAAAAAAAARRVVYERKQELRKKALDYNDARASYKRQVSKLRYRYKQEVDMYQKEDEAAVQADRELKTRRRLERQRAKNERSLRNAIRQKELQRQQRLVFEDHLHHQQQIRDANHQLHQRARQLVINDLEEESKLWLTSVEEVEEAFAQPGMEQLLWVKPQSVLGVPNPSLDSHFWSYEGHTWDRSRTYKTKAEILLERLEQKVYDETNISKSVWTADREDEHESLTRKAKLRALIRQAGRKSLLRRQREYLEEEQLAHDDADNAEPPKPLPTPSLGVLANIKAQEKEGAEMLLKDPRQFFVFAANDDDGGTSTKDGNVTTSTEDDEIDPLYAGPSLGKPIEIRDPLRTGQPQGRVYPQVIGKLPKADVRTEKEKKRQEREERLWAAAQMKGEISSTNDDDDMLLAEEDRDIGEAIDYEEAELNWDSDDEEWKKGLDPEDRKLQVPREYRFFDDDIDKVIHELQLKADSMESHVKNSIRTMEEEARSRITTTTESTGATKDINNIDTAAVTALSATDATAIGTDDDNENDDSAFFDEETTTQLTSVGADVEKYEALMASLSREQLLSLFALEAKEMNVGDDDVVDDDVYGDASSSSSPSTKVFEEIPGLTDQQIAELTELESFIRIAEKQQQETSEQ